MLEVAERHAVAVTSAAGGFARDGFVGPLPLIDPQRCRALVDLLNSPEAPAPAIWLKGGAATDWRLSKLGSNPRLLALLTPLLGPNIILWGAKLIARKPGQVHLWHVDSEASAPSGRFVTAWIGLHNTTGESGIRMIAGSHLCRTVEEFQGERGCLRTDTSTETALDWAQSENPDARLIEPEVGNGEVILFDGRMWHGSHNRLSDKTRFALLLQFASADSPVRITSDEGEQRAPSILVQGHVAPGANWVVPPPLPPSPKKLPALASSIDQLALPLAENPERGWQRYPLFVGTTPSLASMSCHAAVLSPGHSPHPPHSHQDEELLIVLNGEAELLVSDRPSYEAAHAIAVKAGDFAYYHALQHHTIRNASTAPVTYLMFRWHGRIPSVGGQPLRSNIYRSPPPAEASAVRPFQTRSLFGAPTRWLGKLHCHTSRLEVGGGYAEHVDPYDVAILVQSGRVQTLGGKVGPGGVIFYPKGERHGMRNAGDQPARYLVFEFHPAARIDPRTLAKAPRPGCVVSA
jgi:uncharacterized cupin superfamily protein